MRLNKLKNVHLEITMFNSRILIAFLLVVLAFILIFSRYLFLQVVEHKTYTALSNKNRIQVQALAPRRGLIYDRKGVVLAENRPSYNLNIRPDKIKDMDAVLIEVKQLIGLTDAQAKRFHRRLNQPRRSYAFVPLRFYLTEQEIAKILANYHRLPGVNVAVSYLRHYPHGADLTHVLGYVGRISAKDLDRLDPANYRATQYVGKLGVEKYYESELHGRAGYQKVEVNAKGQIMRILERKEPVHGKHLVLNLDLALQKRAMRLLKGKRASVVAINPKDGGILALASTPSYDPNLFVTGISHKEYAELRESKQLPLFNRALSGRYPPGSIIKPIVALAAIDTGAIPANFSIDDPGWYSLEEEGRRYRDWKEDGHDHVDLKTAIAESCDVWFYSVAHKIGLKPIYNYLKNFGFGAVQSLDLPQEVKANLPNAAWKKSHNGKNWYVGDTLNLSIGQGYLVATPMQLATATNVLANRGVFQQPKMLAYMSQEPYEETTTAIDYKYLKQSPADVQLRQPKYWQKIVQSMQSVVHSNKGTARRIAPGLRYKVAGKTGTSQVFSVKQDDKYNKDELAKRLHDHALFVAFAPVKQPKIALAVVVENGGSGSATAAPIARKLMDTYILNKPTPVRAKFAGQP